MSGLGGFSMFDLFREEAENHAGALESGLLQLEADPGDASVAIEPLMRAAHSIKGAARIIGLDIAVGLAHAMEDVFVAVQDGRETLVSSRVDQLLQGTDFLRSLSALEESAVEAWSSEHQAAIDALVEQLRADAPADAAPAVAVDVESTPAAESETESEPEPESEPESASKPETAPAPKPRTERSPKAAPIYAGVTDSVIEADKMGESPNAENE